MEEDGIEETAISHQNSANHGDSLKNERKHNTNSNQTLKAENPVKDGESRKENGTPKDSKEEVEDATVKKKKKKRDREKQKKKLHSFYKWLKDNGVQTEHVEIVGEGTHERGMRALRDIKAGKILENMISWTLINIEKY